MPADRLRQPPQPATDARFEAVPYIVGRRMIDVLRRDLALREGRVRSDAYIIAWCLRLKKRKPVVFEALRRILMLYDVTSPRRAIAVRRPRVARDRAGAPTTRST